LRAFGLLALTLVAGLLIARADATPVAPPSFDVERRIELGMSAAVPEAGFVIHFDELLSDGRCPANVVCIWEGNARIALTVKYLDGRRVEIELDTAAALNRTAILADDVGITLLTLSRSDGDNPGPTRATLRIFAPATPEAPL
jgi:hypothetical protein